MQRELQHRRHNPAKYLAMMAISLKHNLRYQGDGWVRAVFYLIVLLVFSQLWLVLGDEIAALGITPRDAVWYIAITEWITLATPFIYLEIQQAVQEGTVATRLPRPMSYLWASIAEGCGSLAVRLLMLGVTGFFGAWYFASGLPSEPMGLVYAIPLGLVAAFDSLLLMVIIGLGAVWIQEVSPFNWINNKCLMVLGGMLVPIAIYPEWLQTVASLTPWYALLYGVGRLVLKCDAETLITSTWMLALWTLVLIGITQWIYSRALKSLSVNGG